MTDQDRVRQKDNGSVGEMERKQMNRGEKNFATTTGCLELNRQ
jgi:hypothetical protein